MLAESSTSAAFNLQVFFLCFRFRLVFTSVSRWQARGCRRHAHRFRSLQFLSSFSTKLQQHLLSSVRQGQQNTAKLGKGDIFHGYIKPCRSHYLQSSCCHYQSRWDSMSPNNISCQFDPDKIVQSWCPDMMEACKCAFGCKSAYKYFVWCVPWWSSIPHGDESAPI